MSLPKESIQVIAQTMGITKLKDEIAQALASDVEYRVRSIIQDAAKFMRHSKRKTLSVKDVNRALVLKNVEPLYGFQSSGTTVDHKQQLGFRRVSHSKDLYFLEDQEIDIKECLQTPLPKVPIGPTISAHWLAISGIQPRIPQNPIQILPPKQLQEKKKEEVTVEEKQTIKRTEGIVVESTQQNVEVKQLVKHVLSAELQMYYEKVTEAIKGKKPLIRRAALESLSQDAGLHQLVPYFTQFIAQEVTNNLRNLNLLYHLMEMVKAILTNPNLHVELYLHQFMPSVLTCLVGRRLCENPKQNHWELRDYAASIVALVCKKYGSAYSTLQPRITKTLLHAFLDPTRPRTTQYGAIVGITALGPHVTQMLLLEPPKNSNLKVYIQFLKPELQSQDSLIRHEALMCYGALMNAASSFFVQLGRFFRPRDTDLRASLLKGDVKAIQKEKFVEEMDEDEETQKEQKKQTNDKYEPTKEEYELTKRLRERMSALNIPEDIALRYSELYDIFGESLLPSMFYHIVPETEDSRLAMHVVL